MNTKSNTPPTSADSTKSAESRLTKADIVALGWSPVYIERSLTKGALKGAKYPIPGRKTVRWEVTQAAYDTWRATRNQNRGVFTGTSRDIQNLDEFLKSAKPNQIAAIRKSLAAAEAKDAK